MEPYQVTTNKVGMRKEERAVKVREDRGRESAREK
jgi:hypothetical protein